MSLTIAFDADIVAELEAEASARGISREQVAQEAVESYFQRPQSPSLEYDVFFRKKYEEGREDYRAGRFRTDEEVEKEAMIRREKIKAMIADRQCKQAG